MTRALILGVTGQDGSYLAEQLTAAGYEVIGMVRGQSLARREWLTRLVPGIHLVEGDLLDQASLCQVIADTHPDEVYNLAAISAPAIGWRQPLLMADVTGLGALRLFEAVRLHAPGARVVQAASLATHGPYGAAKTLARAMAADYRARGLHVACAVFGGHHSPRRGPEFFSRKVTRAAARIRLGLQQTLHLGWLGRLQDWGWAEDFTRPLPLIAQAPPDDYVVSTGQPHTSQEWVDAAFTAAGLDWHEHVRVDQTLSQPTDVATLSADPDPRLPWTPRQAFEALAETMVAADLAALREEVS